MKKIVLFVLPLVFAFLFSSLAFALRGVVEISNVTFTPSESFCGDRITANVTVRNLEQGPVPMFSVGIKVRGEVNSLASLDLGRNVAVRETLSANQSKTYTLSFNFPQAQTSSVVFEVFASCQGGEYGDTKEYQFKAKYVLQRPLTIERIQYPPKRIPRK